MRQKIEFDQITRKSRKITLINIQETDHNGKVHTHEMQLRHALMAMRVSPEKFKLAPGEQLPKGISVDMVPIGTTVKDVEEFEKIRGTVGKVRRTNFDNILEAIENGIEIVDVDVEKDVGAIPGAMMSEEAPKGFVPEGVDLTPAETMLAETQPGGTDENESVFDEAEKEVPALGEIKEKELTFDEGQQEVTKFTKTQLNLMAEDKLQAILLNLPNVKNRTEKYQKDLLKGAKKEKLIETILQLSKTKK